LKEKVTFTVLILILIQFLSGIPLFGINRELLSSWLDADAASAFGIFNMFSGMSFQNMSIFALGIAPYITSSIIIQLLRIAVPALDDICKDGQYGKENTEKITYITAAIIGVIEIIPFVYGFASGGLLIKNNALYIGIVGVSLFLGSAILIILGKLIEKRGIGQGISLILMLNILSTMPNDIMTIYAKFINDKSALKIILALVVIVLVIAFTLIGTVLLQEGKKDIKTSFSGKLSGNKMNRHSESSIPLRVNMAGVMPIIFASSLMQMPIMIVSFFGIDEKSWFAVVAKYLNQGNWFNLQDFKYTLGFIPYVLLVVFFAYFYNMISFNTNEISRDLAKRGGTIKGIRPGKTTAEYLDKQLEHLLLLGALMLICIASVPIVVSGLCGIQLSFGGTSLLIIVSVMVETYKAYETETLQDKAAKKGLGGIF
jgi:preprotein translocase subunit SecY